MYTINKTRNKKYALKEKASDQIIAESAKARNLTDLKKRLEGGTGFNGQTPRFLLSGGPLKV